MPATIARATVVAALVGLTGIAARASEPKITAEQRAIMARWETFATPGKAHQALDPLVGKWDHVVRSWTTPGAESQESAGTSEIKWILGDRYLQQNLKGVVNKKPFEGLGIVAYDNVKKQYMSLWFDTMGTGVTNAVGSFDNEGRILSENGSFTDPTSGVMSFRAVTTLVDADHFRYEMFNAGPDGKEFRSMEIVYTRKK